SGHRLSAFYFAQQRSAARAVARSGASSRGGWNGDDDRNSDHDSCRARGARHALTVLGLGRRLRPERLAFGFAIGAFDQSIECVLLKPVAEPAIRSGEGLIVWREARVRLRSDVL